MENKKVIKWILFSLAVVTGGAIIYVQVKKILDKDKDEDIIIPEKDKIDPNKNKFPLKKGVKGNDYVATLQAALGVKVDKWFGKDTLAALQLKANKSEISNLQDLNNTLEIIKQYNKNNGGQQRADKILELLYGRVVGDTQYGGDHTTYALNKPTSLQLISFNNVSDVWEKSGTNVKNLGKGFSFNKDKFLLMKGDDFNGDNIGDLVIYMTQNNTYYSVPTESIEVL